MSHNLYCPITKMIFLEPYSADDGFIYEGEAIFKWLGSNKNSPLIPSKKINEKPIFSQLMKNMVTEYLEKHQEKKVDQYTKDPNDIYLFDGIKITSEGHILENIKRSYGIEIVKKICQNDSLIRKIILAYKDKNIYSNIGNGKRLIHYVSSYCSYGVFEYLLSFDIDIEAKDSFGNSVIFDAATNSDVRIFKFLYEYGFSIESKNDSGDKPIHAACQSANLNVINFLIEHKANFDRDRYGSTPLDMMRSNPYDLMGNNIIILAFENLLKLYYSGK